MFCIHLHFYSLMIVREGQEPQQHHITLNKRIASSCGIRRKGNRLKEKVKVDVQQKRNQSPGDSAAIPYPSCIRYLMEGKDFMRKGHRNSAYQEMKRR